MKKNIIGLALIIFISSLLSIFAVAASKGPAELAIKGCQHSASKAGSKICTVVKSQPSLP